MVAASVKKGGRAKAGKRRKISNKDRSCFKTVSLSGRVRLA